MATVIIPLNPESNQSFPITLEINGVNRELFLSFRYNSIAGYWLMDVTNNDTDIMLLASVPLLPGASAAVNLFVSYRYLGIGAAFILSDGQVAEQYPSESTLGTNWFLVWGDDA